MPTTGSPISIRSQGSTVARIAAWSLAAAIVILSLVPPALRPDTSAPHSLEHLIIYAATGFAFGLGYTRRHDLLAVLLVIFSSCHRDCTIIRAGTACTPQRPHHRCCRSMYRISYVIAPSPSSCTHLMIFRSTGEVTSIRHFELYAAAG